MLVGSRGRWRTRAVEERRWGKPERSKEKSQIYLPAVEKSIVWDKLLINVIGSPITSRGSGVHTLLHVKAGIF